jgi:hypothetical protein
LYCFVKFLLSFFTLVGGRECGLIFHLLYLFIVKKLVLLLLFKGRKGAQDLLKLVKRGGNGVDFFVLEKLLLKDGNGRWVGCGFSFLKVLIVDWGGGHGLYFFTFFTLFMFVMFWVFHS